MWPGVAAVSLQCLQIRMPATALLGTGKHTYSNWTVVKLYSHILQGRTQPAARLSERDLIALMEQHNIGTDATVAEHIQKQLDRGYATKDANMTFWPTSLGEALVGAYRKMGLENLWLPNLRWASVRKKRKEKTTPFSVNLMRSQLLHRAAQSQVGSCHSVGGACLPY
jgi:hypothetical protein